MNLETDIQSKFEELNEQAAAEAQSDLFTFDFADLMDKKDEEQLFLIPDLLPAHAVAVLIGEDGIGKTQILTQLCIQIAAKRNTFLTLPLVTKSNRALIVATEDSRQKFIRAAAKQYAILCPEINPKELKIKFTEGSEFDDYGALIAEIVRIISAEPHDLVVIDAMSDLFTLIDGEINSNAHARKILGVLQKICGNYNTTIIIVHHAAKTKIVQKRKDGKLFVVKDDAQGAGAITQKPRTVLALTHDPKTILNNGLSYKNFFHVVKANLMSKFYVTKAIELAFDAATLIHNWVQLVNIEEYEQGNPINNEEQVTPIYDAVTQRHINEQYLTAIFSGVELLTREDLINKIMSQYKVGRNRVEKKGGLLAEFMEQGLIEKEGKYFKHKTAVPKTPHTPPPGFFGEDDPLQPSSTTPPNNTDTEDKTPF